ncbi:MAG TPA: DUF4118 domain-containing protein [Bryobacteraceae bacterium]|nr:DUF4118 domain-containing protein [Bryobacteraceae bacterium]
MSFAHGARIALRVALAILGVALVTATFRQLSVNEATVGMGYLITVLAVATAWGIGVAVVASIVAMLCYNFFFLPPVGTFTIADPQNWVSLFAFLTAAVVASELSARAQRQKAAALARQRELERLYALGRAILLDQGERPLPHRLAKRVAESFELPAVVLYDVASDRQYQGGPEDLTIPPDILNTALSGDIARADNLTSRFASIRLGGKPEGVLGIRGQVSDTTMDAISNLVAVGLERARTIDSQTKAHAARQSEELKSTLLDAIAHEFKTPLTSIKAASTTILSDESLPPNDRELLHVIDEEADRLNSLVTDAIDLSRIEGGKFRLHTSSVNIGDLLERVVRQMGSRLRGRTIQRLPTDGVPSIEVDSNLIELALRQMLDNAVKYSPPVSPIYIGADRRNGEVVLWVSDQGPGISPADADLVFEPFFRGNSGKHGVPGTGLGLSVVRRIARAHGGDAQIAPKAPNGARVEMFLPLTPSAPD